MPPSDNNRIFVGNLSWQADEDGLKDYFSTVGPVEEVHIMRENHPPHRSRGYAFVSFSSFEASDLAIAELNDKEYMGRPLNINRAQPRGQHKNKTEAAHTTE